MYEVRRREAAAIIAAEEGTFGMGKAADPD